MLLKALLWGKPWPWRVSTSQFQLVTDTITLEMSNIYMKQSDFNDKRSSKPARTEMGVSKRGESRVWEGSAQKEGIASATCECLENSKRNGTNRVTWNNHEHSPRGGTRGTQCNICPVVSLTRGPVTLKLCQSVCLKPAENTLSKHHPLR